MIIHFARVPNKSRIWYAYEPEGRKDLSFFHYSLGKRIADELTELGLQVVCPSIVDTICTGKSHYSILIEFDNDADEAAFIVQMSAGLKITY